MTISRGVRARLAATLVALVALTAIVLGVGASWFVDATLHDRALQDAATQARFDLSVVVPERQLPTPATVDDIVRSSLAETFRQRGVETIVDLGSGAPFVSRSDLVGALDGFPADLRDRVSRGELAYAWLDIAGKPSVVVGGRAAGSGPTFYFVRDVSYIVAAVDQLRIALAVGALGLLVLALLASRIVARGVLAPVEAASRAAERIERGDLSARVPIASRDEFGAWAERFNRMAAALEETIGRLQTAQAQNRRFVADVSHELRTPLAALVAEASIVGAHLDALPSESRRAAELLVADVGRLRALVEELMELSRFDAAAEQVALDRVDLVRLIQAVIAARLPDAVFVPPAPAVIVDTDPRRLERILGNLLDNAREHAPGALVEVDLRVTEDEVSMAVLDRGPGVPEPSLDRIFDRFSKLDPSRHGGSSGLGLAIAAEHAALLGGHIEASNRVGGGLRLAIVLPLDVAEPLPRGDTSATRGYDAGARSTQAETQR